MSEKFPAEELLIKVIDDLADFLPYLVLVGGWVPYVYAKFIWGGTPNLAVSTSDIDFGVSNKQFLGKDTVTSRVRMLNYGERHVSMDRMYPFVPVVQLPSASLKAEVEFITDPKVPKKAIEQLIGGAIKINEIENFHLLLESLTTAMIHKHTVQIPTTSMFVFHKLLTFVQRGNKIKFKKDLYYVYYLLRFSPDRQQLIDDICFLIKGREQGKQVVQNLNKYFKSIDADGPLLVEQENGPDPYISDVRKDVFERFKNLREKVKHA